MRRPICSAIVLAFVASLAAAVGAQQPAPRDTAPATAAPATLAGVVHDTAGRGIAWANVFVEDSDVATVADDSGRFRLPNVPPGVRRFVARRIGYEPAVFQIDMPVGLTVHVNVKLPTAAYLLSTVEITAQERDARLAAEGFYERQRRRIGKYLGPDEVEKRRSFPSVARMIGDFPGIEVRPGRPGESPTITGRTRRYSINGGAQSGCLALFLDGMRLPQGVNLDDFTDPKLIYAIEVYADRDFIPGRFVALAGGRGCGAIVVWTKQMRMPKAATNKWRWK